MALRAFFYCMDNNKFMQGLRIPPAGWRMRKKSEFFMRKTGKSSGGCVSGQPLRISGKTALFPRNDGSAKMKISFLHAIEEGKSREQKLRAQEIFCFLRP